MHKLLVGIFLLGLLLRVLLIDKFPAGFNPDEASFGYDAYSLLKTGHDQWGHFLPLSFQSFGDFKLPLYSYLAIPTVALFGLNEFAVRLPNALFGSLAIIATYLMVLEIFKDRKLALASAFLLAISPWHISLSRGAFEANLTTFFLPIGIYAFYRGLIDKKWMTFAALIFGLNLFSYHSARLITPLLVLALFILNSKKISLSKNAFPVVIFVIFCLVAGYTMLVGGAARGADIAIFNPTDHGEAVFQERHEATLIGLPDQVSRLFSNKFTFVFNEFTKNYLNYFSLNNLFGNGAAEWTYGMIPGFGLLYLVQLPFLFFAGFYLIKNKSIKAFLPIIIWLLLAPIPAALTKVSGFAANRAAIEMPALQIISALGMLTFFEITKSKFIKLLTFSFLGISLLVFLENYFYHAPFRNAQAMQYGRGEMVQELNKIEPNYSQIIVSRSLSEPHIYFAFYDKWDPTDYQMQTRDWMRYKDEGRSFIDQLGEYHLGKYTFSDIKFAENSEKENILLVGKPEEFPKDITPFKVINYPDKKPAIYIVGPQKYASR